uniref:ribonuclease H n=1 Tax=Oryzias latipes TaxID=8090 RepID=A0A3B3HGA7_ORYLA
MLVITDYATKYPDVFPLKSIKAKSVASSLVQLFSRVGFPLEILTDRGSNFMSNLLKQVYKLLGIKRLRTTPYHPQTDGLTERFNQTLKQMLRKFVDETGSDWDQWLPYLLFAYREVPQASTGFSPFELLYGHEVRGPLSLLKETWGGENKEHSVNLLSYVLQMRERLERMRELAHSHMLEAQQYQKGWYDKSARQRSFNPGQRVLVLLPSEGSKLLAKWQGPFEVQQKLGPSTYRVATPGQPRSNRVLHVNLLKEWVDRPTKIALLIRGVQEEEDGEEQYLPVTTSVDLDLSHLPQEKQLQVRALTNSKVFQENPGRTNIVSHDIVLKEGASVRRLSYRIPERLLIPLKEEVDLMLSLGIIEPSKSDWCHPVVLVPKKDGSMRFCIDFRYLNANSKFDSYPTPRIDDLVERLGKAKYLSTIDLCKGYWQVPLAERCRELTAFRTPVVLFQFTVMPFGLHGAPATFQRLMDKVLYDISNFTAAYLDDIIVYSDTWEEHMKHLECVLERLQSAGLTVNPSKCDFAKAETQYLGYVIGNGMIKPQVNKVSAIEACPLPQTRKELRSFLGMAGFYQRFIPHFSTRAAPLTDMTGAKCPNKIKWTEDAVTAFKDLQKSLSESPVLYSPDFEKPFVLQTDASERGLGAVLLQGTSEERHPVAYVSRKLLPREVRYSTVEKETLAIKWALDSLRYYLLGREFILETDHKALQWLNKMKDSNGRITRWYLSMQPFCFTIRHVPGKINCIADYLSRRPDQSPEGEGSVMTAVTQDYY